MKKILILLTTFLLTACGATVSTPVIVNMPSEYDSDRTQELLKSIDYQSLQSEVIQNFPEAQTEMKGFYFVPLVFKSATGKPDRMVVRVDTKPESDWSKKNEVEEYLGKYLESRIEP